ncbi:uncharacterized protein LOC110034761 [Phalaenopsis equestris]|uniref:uncharacterized protein LOC110034761 n=1 Tax=Phalaenopsis equestris TaxID=78828 RepID=UPI0009E458C8|nr:uncharacterized protein LOC110034761 [Phalaenopsis equestris]
MISCNLYFLMRDTWSSMCTLFQFSTAIQATEVTSEASMWRSLWNDLFSQIFRALRSILYGFVAFFTTCNRHRLSIYNHIQELFLRFSNVTNSNLTRTRKKSSDENHATGSSKSTPKQSFRPKEKAYRRRTSVKQRDMR